MGTDQEDKQIAKLSNTITESEDKRPKAQIMDLQNQRNSIKDKENIKSDKDETSITQKRSETEDIKDELQNETTLIDISIIGEKENRNSDLKKKNEASEMVSALSKMPGISKSVSQEILSK